MQYIYCKLPFEILIIHTFQHEIYNFSGEFYLNARSASVLYENTRRLIYEETASNTYVHHTSSVQIHVVCDI